MQERRKNILNMLSNTMESLTAAKLSKVFNVSERTIRQDIQDINCELLVHHIKVDSDTRNGYSFSSENKLRLLELENVNYHEKEWFPQEPKHRQANHASTVVCE